MAKPIKNGKITFPYGAKYSDGGVHKGVDFAVPQGTPVYAAVAGTVVHSGTHLSGGWSNRGWGTAFGVHIVIDNNKFADGTPGLWSCYGHMSKVVVALGDKVKKGQLIGYTGNTGNSTGPHLHFQVNDKRYWDATAHHNPDRWLKA
mgnify:CR=1 FL=1